MPVGLRRAPFRSPSLSLHSTSSNVPGSACLPFRRAPQLALTISPRAVHDRFACRLVFSRHVFRSSFAIDFPRSPARTGDAVVVVETVRQDDGHPQEVLSQLRPLPLSPPSPRRHRARYVFARARHLGEENGVFYYPRHKARCELRYSATVTHVSRSTGRETSSRARYFQANESNNKKKKRRRKPVSAYSVVVAGNSSRKHDWLQISSPRASIYMYNVRIYIYIRVSRFIGYCLRELSTAIFW